MRSSRLCCKAQRVIFSASAQLGNYLGALKNWVNLQDAASPSDKLFYSIVGLHALTLPQDPDTLRKKRMETMATLLAVGLDPTRCTIFQQDQVHQHTELAWILNCITPVGKLFRMTTWKARLADSRNANAETEVSDSLLQLGLLAYPVLQAADVLLYNTTEIPVGEDQHQHIELARDIAQSFNSQFKQNVLALPRHVSTPQARIASLKAPESKMSKSSPVPKGRILLTDTPDVIAARIKGAVTDTIMDVSVDWASRPGIRNLFTIMSGVQDQPVDTLVKQYQGKNAGQLKKDLAEMVVEALAPIRDRYERLTADEAYLSQVEEVGRAKASEEASRTLDVVKRTIGIL